MGNHLVIALFRHGLTKENEQRKYIGWLDSHLCRSGVEELRKKQLTVPPYQKLYTSDLKRAQQTAALLFPNQFVTITDHFREMNFGDWEGNTYEQLKDDTAYQNWLNEPFVKVPKNGESFSRFSKRVEQGWQTLIEESKNVDRLAVITHGGVIRYLLSHYGPEEKGFWEYSINHGQGIELIWEKKDSFRRRQRCTLLQEVIFTEKNRGP